MLPRTGHSSGTTYGAGVSLGAQIRLSPASPGEGRHGFGLLFSRSYMEIKPNQDKTTASTPIKSSVAPV